MFFAFINLLIHFPIVLFLYIKDKIKSRGEVHLYGIYGFLGLPGAGKTMALTKQLDEFRKKYKDKIYITTNYFYKNQDFPFEKWEDLFVARDKPVVVGWDEIQNDFSSRNFKNFPFALLDELTQVRKGNGVRIYYTTQDFAMPDINFRRLTFNYTDCITVLGRFAILKTYQKKAYEQLVDTVQIEKKMKIKPIKVETFIQTDKLRDSYDSYKRLESARKKEYMDRIELAKINNKN